MAPLFINTRVGFFLGLSLSMLSEKTIQEVNILSGHLINTWHCDEENCDGIFYTDLNSEQIPAFCPYCGENYLSDSKILEAKPLTYGK